MAKRSADDYAEMSRAVEAGEYTAGPLEMGAMLHEGRPIDDQSNQPPPRDTPHRSL
ncbi:hypothetical protein [Mycobacterium malmoense]|uniref:hypothetical protein n=1 Tax=Mycobacterium malmoense TaxID=1780 RepID=UPI0015A5FAE0|nr:hypothetical protein [Mycobacterium malmoense]